ncbi:MAG: hypothetical protein JO244_04725 [Solirubrobacterales bacterium]|nr:hypothetical protein [Solirubrobacterales bacterium]
MTPSSYHEFFVASAGVAGALIGLLFVAMSVAQERLQAEDANQRHRVRASAALTAFTNALAVALFALIPGVGLRWPALAVGATGLLFVAGSLLSLVRTRAAQSLAPRDLVFLVGLGVVFGFQVYYALRLVSGAGDVGAAQGIAILVVICFLIGIARSWELVGGPSITFTREVMTILRGHGGQE